MAPTRVVKTLSSEQFNAPDADIVYRSSDGVQFRIHANNLRPTSGCLLPTLFTPDAQVVDLTEESSTLELMFQFTYPQLQPKVDDLAFESLSKLVEAAEKYQIYSAMPICNVNMTNILPNHAVEVLDYSIRHSYPLLSNRAAPFVTLTDISKLSGSVSPLLLCAWLKYYNHWFAQVRKAIVESHHYFSNHLSCSEWTDSAGKFLKALLDASTSVTSEKTVFALINVRENSKQCCRSAAGDWQKRFKEKLGVAPQFTDFL